MHIAVIYSVAVTSGYRPSHQEAEDDTRVSAELIRDACVRLGHRTELIPVKPSNLTVLDQLTADCIFNCIEWTGADLPLADDAFMRLERSGIPVTGASRKNYLETTDKIHMKKRLVELKLPTPPYFVCVTGREKVPEFHMPMLVKIATEHSGVGLRKDSLVYSDDELRARIHDRIKEFHEPILIEEFISGREFEVTLLEGPEGLIIFPPAENAYDSHSPSMFLTFEGRWNDEHNKYVSYDIKIPRLSDVSIHNLHELCQRAFIGFGFSGYARFDMRMKKDGSWVFIETNSNPGLDDNVKGNGLAASFHKGRYTFDHFISDIIATAVKKTGA